MFTIEPHYAHLLRANREGRFPRPTVLRLDPAAPAAAVTAHLLRQEAEKLRQAAAQDLRELLRLNDSVRRTICSVTRREEELLAGLSDRAPRGGGE